MMARLTATSAQVAVTTLLHAALLSPTTKKWTSASGATNYWSAAVTVAAHGANDRPIAGATITVAWTGGVTKTASCVTASTGQCTLQSGTLSYLRSWVTLTVTNVAAPLSTYSATANHTREQPGIRSHDEQAVRLGGELAEGPETPDLKTKQRS